MAIIGSNGFTRRGILGAFAATVIVAAPAFTAAAGYLKGAGDIRAGPGEHRPQCPGADNQPQVA